MLPCHFLPADYQNLKAFKSIKISKVTNAIIDDFGPSKLFWSNPKIPSVI